jgi:predicted ABC-type ATPase
MPDEACIYVLAGTNGAGKSSVLGEMAIAVGAEYFNPDEATRRILEANPGASLAEANAAAWNEGRRLLERAINQHLDYMFETTLGGNTFVGLLQKALGAGLEVRVSYVGLASPELHVARVAARVAKGGHDIPEAKIRERYDKGREHLIALLPGLTEMRVYDNSAEGDPDAGAHPRPRLLLHVTGGRITTMCGLEEVSAWAKPIVLAAIESDVRAGGSSRVCP